MTLWVQANFGHDEKIRDYWVRTCGRLLLAIGYLVATPFQIKKAEVQAIAELQRELPELKGLFPEGPVDPTKVRYVVLLENNEGELRRARCIQFNDPNLEKYRAFPKDMFAGQPVEWSDILMYTVENSTPEETMDRFTGMSSGSKQRRPKQS